MGVGVYESDFNGTGGTFLIDGPLGDKDDYDRYVRDRIADEKGCRPEDVRLEEDGHDGPVDDPGDHGVASYEDWSQEQYDDFNLELVEAVERAGRELGFGVNQRRGFRAERAGFDSEFVGVASCGAVEVGWRSWQHDFVVGVGPVRQWREWMASPDSYAEDVVEATGRSPAKVAAAYADLAAKVQEYVRLRLMADGFECRYRTSGYTTGRYEHPEGFDAEARAEALKGEVAALAAYLEASPEQALAQADREERVALARTLRERNDGCHFGRDHNEIGTEIPVYAPGRDAILLFNPYVANPRASLPVPDALRPFLRGLDAADGLAAVPRTEETEAWFAEQAARPGFRGEPRLLVSADEYAEAVGEECVVTVDAEDGQGFDEHVLADGGGPAPGVR